MGKSALKFTSIRKKLIAQVSLILAVSFASVLSLISYMSVQESTEFFEQNEVQIERALIEKGKLLTENNSIALIGMIEDNAFSAIQELVSSTVRSDRDILFGSFVDMENSPWVKVTPNNPTGFLEQQEILVDVNTQWASSLKSSGVKKTTMEGYSVYLFAAPVTFDSEIQGFIQYALSNRSVLESIESARNQSDKSLRRTLSLLILLGCLAGGMSFIAVRKMAVKLSQPLNALKEAAENIGDGDYQTKIHIDSNDEIGLLAGNFNSMRKTIKKKIKDLSELNALGRTLSVIKSEKDVFRLTLISSHVHANAKYSYIHSRDKEIPIESQCHQPENAEDPIWNNALQNLISSYVASNLETCIHQMYVLDDIRTVIEVPFLAGETIVASMFLCGDEDSLVFSDSDREYYQSLAQVAMVSHHNLHLKHKIEIHNRDLEVTIGERTTSLREKTNDISSMMQNLSQGLFTIIDKGIVHHEYAKHLETIFNTPFIAGSNAIDLLFSHSTLGEDRREQITAVVYCLIGSDEMMFEFNCHLLVSHIEVTLDQVTKNLELDWKPIVHEGRISKIMVAVRDVTKIKVLEGETKNQQKELNIISHLLSVKIDDYLQFISTTGELIANSKELIDRSPQEPLDTISGLFRNMHTIKGNARIYGFSYISDHAHSIENYYDKLRNRPNVSITPTEILSKIRNLECIIQQYGHVNDNILNRKIDSMAENCDNHRFIEKSKLSILHDDINQLNRLNLSSPARNLINNLSESIDSLNAETLEQSLSGICRVLPALAKDMGKRNPNIIINAEGVLIKESAAKLITNIITHSISNSLCHGIDNSEVRIDSGKSPEGNISIDARIVNQMLELEIYDDGKGLAIKKIREQAILRNKLNEGEQFTRESLNKTLFSSGLSTSSRVTDMSGRGVGMDAIKHAIDDAGGSVIIEFLDDINETENDFIPFKIHIRLPSGTFVESCREKRLSPMIKKEAER
ncbi:hypothetical protein A9Q99_04745 [Gammaproteobacteria bacterium 45_16_T64]|nr:hypothetical protein A9Q99_04745 [Gammaproteobacteria bacterium 45_16_T64]